MSQRERKIDGLTLGEIRKLRDSEMTPAQKLALYGPGNPDRMLYRIIERDGKGVLVSRVFAAGDEIPEGWVTSPAELGIETQPAAEHRSLDEYDSVLGEVDIPAPAPAATKKAAKNAA